MTDELVVRTHVYNVRLRCVTIHKPKRKTYNHNLERIDCISVKIYRNVPGVVISVSEKEQKVF